MYEPRKQDTQANKGSPLLSEEVEVPYQITLIGLSQGSLDGRKEKVIWEMFSENDCNTVLHFFRFLEDFFTLSPQSTAPDAALRRADIPSRR